MKVCTICKRNEKEVSFTWKKPYCDECHDIPGVPLYGRPVSDVTVSVGDDIELSESN